MLYRFHVSLSNIDQNFYSTLDFRTSQHPSESLTYLLSRSLAYILSYEERLEFSPHGLADPDEPALQKFDLQGFHDLWIEIGNPPLKKLHKASKTSKRVLVYTYKDPLSLVADLKKHPIHRSKDLEIYAFDPEFLSSLESTLIKNNQWSVLIQDSNIHIITDSFDRSTEVQRYKIDS